MKRGALRTALSERLREGNLVLREEFAFGAPKTKEFVGALKSLGLDGKTLIVDSLENENLLLSSRNVKLAKVVGSSGLNIYDVLYHQRIVLSRAAVDQVTRLLDPKKAGAAATENADEAENGEAATEEAA